MTGIYEVEVVFDSFNNPTGQRANSRCCESRSTQNCPTNTCDTYVQHCFRLLGSTGMTCPNNDQLTITTDSSQDTDSLTSSLLPGATFTDSSAWEVSTKGTLPHQVSGEKHAILIMALKIQCLHPKPITCDWGRGGGSRKITISSIVMRFTYMEYSTAFITVGVTLRLRGV